MKAITRVIFLLLPCVSFAQWNVVNEIYSPIVYALYSSEDNIYAGTIDSMYISDDRGNNWHSVNFLQNSPATVTAIIRQDSILYAGTYGEGVFKSSNNGQTWEDYNTGLGGFSLYAKRFMFINDTLFLGTDGAGIYYRVISSGGGWVAFNNGIPMNYSSGANDICATSDTYIYSGGASGFYYIRAKGSSEWIEKTLDTTGRQATTPKTFLTFNDTILAGSRAGIFRSVDHGYTWDSVGIRALPLDVKVLKKDGSRTYAGYSRTGDYFIWYSDDNGTTWNVLDHQFEQLIDMLIYDNKIWAGTVNGLWYSSPLTGVSDDKSIAHSYMLEQNYPNPFNPISNFGFRISSPGHVEIKVYDIIGREVALLINEEKPAGEYTIRFDASNLASGVYYYQMRVNSFVQTKKMVLLK